MISLNEKGQISIPENIKGKIEELQELLKNEVAHLDHYERFFALSYIADLICSDVDWSHLFKISPSNSTKK